MVLFLLLILSCICFLPKVVRACALALFLLLGSVQLALSGLNNLSSLEPLAQLSISSHHVTLQDAQGRPLGTYQFTGDLVGVRIKAVEFSPFLRFLGLKNKCYLDGIYNGYKDLNQYATAPHQGFSLKSSLATRLWDTFFFHGWKLPLVRAFTLKTEYFPLQTEATFLLHV